MNITIKDASTVYKCCVCGEEKVVNLVEPLEIDTTDKLTHVQLASEFETIVENSCWSYGYCSNHINLAKGED